MCIFSQRVVSVNDTQIFARLSGGGTQFLAYQMKYESTIQNAMILPIPVRRPATEDSIQFIDLKNYPDLFESFDRGFPYHSPPSIGCSASFDKVALEMLEVFKVGNYIASFVPTLSDFDRLDEKFKLSDEIWAQIPEYENFSFAVFQLAAGSLKPHPMAFEFQNTNDEMFFPTMHIHDGEIHDAERFDHILYLQHAGYDSSVYGYRNADVEDKSTGLVRSKFIASRFCDIGRSRGLIDGDLLVHRKVMRGEYANADTVFSNSGDPLRPTLNIRPWLSYTPWLIAFVAIGWFFNRRSRIKEINESRLTETNEENAT